MPIKVTTTEIHKGRPKKETALTAAQNQERVEANWEVSNVGELVVAMEELREHVKATHRKLLTVQASVRNAQMRKVTLADLSVEMEYAENRMQYTIEEIRKYWRRIASKLEGGEE